MSYVSRRLQVKMPDNTLKVMSETEFAALNAPLILLGEPGAGKSETATTISSLKGYGYFTAYNLASGALAEGLGQCVPVIDGLDETEGDNAGSPLTSILSRLEAEKCSTFVLTCRAADWADIRNERAIQTWFGKKPIVGHLQPLDDSEIIAMVNHFGTYPAGGESFLQQAESRNAVDLARNPQALLLLLAAINESGWPETKRELYQSACEKFATEENAIHRSLNPSRPPVAVILSAAGFMCAQLLLAGKQGVNVDGGGNEAFVRLSDLAPPQVQMDDAKAAVGSLLFKPTGPGNVDPFHRTGAEFLAAQWLSDRLDEGSLSLRRLETLLYKDGHVPRSLRGLHAWLATLNRKETNRFVVHDPYGCFRYGDTAQYSIEQARFLLHRLQDLASMDPYFRSEDWDGLVGGGLARSELRTDILELIQNPEVPYQLSTVMLESLKGTEFAVTVRDQLRNVVRSEDRPYVVRDRALDALAYDGGEEDWHRLALELAAIGSHDAARMSVAIAVDHCDQFSGAELANITNAYDLANNSGGRNLSLGIGYRLFPRMSHEQRRAALPVYASILPESRHDRSAYIRKVEERLLQTLQAYLDGGGTPSAEDLWSWLHGITRYQYRSHGWPAFSVEYFGKHPELRRRIQAIAINNAAEGDRPITNWYLGDIAAGLMFQESDIAWHLEELLANEGNFNDLTDRWRALAEWIFQNQSFTGVAEAVARKQAEGRPELQAIIHDITNRPPPSWEREEKQRQKRWEADQKRKNKARYRNFSSIRQDVSEGRHGHALHDVAMAYMGLYTDVNGIDDPISRVEWFVGSENLEVALNGVMQALHREDLPSPRQIATLEANENKEYFLAKVALMGCALAHTKGEDIEELPRKALNAALATSQWGLYSSEKMLPQGMIERLHAILFSDAIERETFVRDVIEPLLFAGKDHVSGLWDVLESGNFNDLAAKLSLEWLEHSESMSAQSLRTVLLAATTVGSQTEFSNLIARKMAACSQSKEGHDKLWHGAAFVADFERFKDAVSSFADADPARLADLRSALSRSGRKQASDLTVSQLVFIAEAFAQHWPQVPMPSMGWGENSPYENGQFIDVCISSLGDILTEEAQSELKRLVDAVPLSNHLDHARHVLAEQSRSMADAAWSKHTLEDARRVLLKRNPVTIEDLQALVMDELEAMQEHIQNGSFNEVRPFWNGKLPHLENYCRDLIASHLEPRLKIFGIRVHTEGTMPADTRCDLICSLGEKDLPIEIKGQWHDEVWTAANKQLEDNYAKHHRASGRGIYLVLWFGDVAGRNPPGVNSLGLPENAEAMLQAIIDRSPKPISNKTKLFVLDLHKHANDVANERNRELKAKSRAPSKKANRKPKATKTI